MNFQGLLIVLVAALIAVDSNAIDHDKVKPIAQPEPVTVSEKAGVKFKPQMTIRTGCASYPAVNEAGEISGGLKGGGGTSGCEGSAFGSQVYGRAVWHNDLYAIMYAWYFPKGFGGAFPSRRHDWANVVVWIDNPDVSSPTIMGLSLSKSDEKYMKDPAASIPTYAIAGSTMKLVHSLSPLGGSPYMDYYHDVVSRRRRRSHKGGSDNETASVNFQYLVMWDQLSEAVRTALNTVDFGDAKVPIVEANFVKNLEQAWPF